jgi:hypothetical protein
MRRTKARSLASLQRVSGKNTGNPLALVLVEGKTEIQYFRALCRRFERPGWEIVIVTDPGHDPLYLVNDACKRFEKDGVHYEHVFCVFDRDNFDNFEEARERIRALSGRRCRPLPIAEAVSVPSFEVWLILHFEELRKPFANADEAGRYLHDRQLIVNYKKGDVKQMVAVSAFVADAIKNGRRLAELHDEHNGNPFSNVHHLASLISKIEPN